MVPGQMSANARDDRTGLRPGADAGSSPATSASDPKSHSALDTGRNLRNSTRQPLPGWKLRWRLCLRAGDGMDMLAGYKDSAFPACPDCGSPNVVLLAHGMFYARWKGQSYLCLERGCKSRGSCQVEGSDGVERRKARVRIYVFAALLVLVTVLLITGHLGN